MVEMNLDDVLNLKFDNLNAWIDFNSHFLTSKFITNFEINSNNVIRFVL